jgi:pyridoxal phosphate enzyme (YggS family)
MGLVSEEILRDNLRRIQEKIGKSLERAGRGPHEVALMAVTKGFGREAARLSADAGLRLFGENRVQEAEGKYGENPPPGELHLIGHLQGNKAKKAAALFDCVQSIDKFETARELDRHAAALGKKMKVLLQLNTSGEASKSGYRNRGELEEDAERIRALPALSVAGLMTLGPLGGDEKAVRRAFALLKSVFREMKSRSAFPACNILSMGMSQDFELAVEEGATLVRIGTALFGERETQA